MTALRRRVWLDWKVWLGLAISAAALVWVFKDVDPRHVLHELRRADPLLFAGAVFMATSLFAIRAVRWRPLLQPVKPGIDYHPRFAATCIGFMANNLLPARVGEFVRAYALGRMERIPVTAVFGSLVVERMLDAITVIAFLFAAIAAPGFPRLTAAAGDVNSAAWFVLGALGIAAVVLGLIVARPDAAVRLARPIAERLLPERMRRPAVEGLIALIDGFAALRSPALLLQAVVGSVVLWLAGALSFWLGFMAFGIEAPFSAAVFLQSLVALGVSLPSAPGFFGLFEGFARVGLVGVFGVEPGRAVSFAVGFHIGGFVPITLIGLYYAWRFGISRREMLRSEEMVEAAVAGRAASAAGGDGSGGGVAASGAAGAARGAAVAASGPTGPRDAILERAPAKINLLLRVLERRPSGYHTLRTLFCALELHDELRVSPAAQLELAVSGADLGAPDRNLVQRAAVAYHRELGEPPAVRLELRKRIPAGAGLAGGSSDAAATLRALQRLHGSPLDVERVTGLARELGADVPFFLSPSPLAWATGRGDRIEPLPPLPARPVLVVDPGFPVSTADAFEWLDDARAASDGPVPGRGHAFDAGPPRADAWDRVIELAHNDFEDVVCERHPPLGELLRLLRECGARPALLSGSGSCVFGVFEDDQACADAADAVGADLPGARTIVTRTAARGPSG